MTKSILLIEDDYTQAEILRDELKGAMPNVEISRLEGERDVYNYLDTSVANPRPDAIVLDVMLLWARSEEQAAVPEAYDDHARAGIRCAKRLTSHQKTAGVPLIFYSVLELSDIERDVLGLPVIFVRKGKSAENLVNVLRQVLRRNP